MSNDAVSSVIVLWGHEVLWYEYDSLVGDATINAIPPRKNIFYCGAPNRLTLARSEFDVEAVEQSPWIRR